MFDNEQEIAPEQEVQEVVEQAQESQQAAPPQQHADSGKEYNFKLLREQHERIMRERDELARKLQEMQKPQPQQEEDDSINLAPDEIAEGKHLSKMGRKVQKLQEQIAHYQQQTAIQNAESRLKSQYGDFDAIVSPYNIEVLKNQYPELAYTLSQSKDMYSAGVAAYTMIKNLGIDKQLQYEADKQLVQRNAAKPKPIAAVSPQQGDSPLSKANAFANGLTDDLKRQLHKEMVEAMRNK